MSVLEELAASTAEQIGLAEAGIREAIAREEGLRTLLSKLRRSLAVLDDKQSCRSMSRPTVASMVRQFILTQREFSTKDAIDYLADIYGRGTSNIRNALSSLVKDGVLIRVSSGRYRVVHRVTGCEVTQHEEAA